MIGRMLSDKLVSDLSRHMKDALEPQVLRRGLDYYEEGRVKHVHVTDDGLIKAQVRGSAVYDVSLDPHHFYTASRCNCPYVGICKHMAATFFAVYDDGIRNLTGFMEGLRTEDGASSINYRRLLHQRDMTTVPQEGHTEFNPGIRQQYVATDSQKSSMQALSPTSRPSEWMDDLKVLFADIERNHTGLSWFVANCRVIAESRISRWDPHKRGLFLVYFYVYALMSLQEVQRSLAFTDADKQRIVNPVTSMCIEKLKECLNQLCVEAGQPVDVSYAEPLVSLLRERTFSLKDTNQTWKAIYRLLWTQFFDRSQLLPEELAWVETHAVETDHTLDSGQTIDASRKGWNGPAGQHDPRGKHYDQIGLGHARAYLLALQGEDTSAAAILSNLPYVEVAQFVQTCRFCAENDCWDRVLYWLRWFGPVVYQLEWRAQQDIMHYWKESANHGAPIDECARMLRGWTAHGRAFYASFLIEHGLYKEWVNFQLLSDHTPYEMAPGELRIVEHHHPEWLLPLYHQSIQRCVLQKNRQAYRMAARMIRKLRTLYKKLKQPEKFEAYMITFTSEHARLRALQDELRRGKLIS